MENKRVKHTMKYLLPFTGRRKSDRVKTAVELTAVFLALVLAFSLSFVGCKGTTSTASIVWIALYGPIPTVSATEAPTAALSLDFSEPVAELQSGITSSKLNDMFKFKYYKAGSASPSEKDIRAVSLTHVEMGGNNTYKLQVSGAPADGGIVEVTIQVSYIQPDVRIWYLDGSHNYTLPAIFDFRFLAEDGTPIGGPGNITPGTGSASWAIAVTVPAGTDVTALVPTMILNPGNIIDPDKNKEQNFTNPVTYRVMAEDGSSTRTYTVTVNATGE
jgi:hypothetical protein